MGINLRCWIALIILGVSPSVFAETVQVSFDNEKYEMNFTKNYIDFKEVGFSKTIKKEKTVFSVLKNLNY